RLYGANNIALLVPREHAGHVDPRLIEAGVAIRYFRRLGRLSGMAALMPAYRQALAAARPDIVHAHSLGAGVVTRLLRGWGQRRPRVLHCPHGWAFDMESSPLQRATAIALERLLALRADRIAVISHHEHMRARDIGIAEDKIVEIANGIALEAPIVTPAQWDDPRLKLLFVGRLDRQKGVDVLMQAVRPLIDRVSVRVAGAPVVTRQADSLAVPANVEMLGWIDRPGVMAQMYACDALVVPSRWEGFGLVALEAMRIGKPVIASAVGGLRDILGDGIHGITVPPGDPVALCATLALLDRARLADMATRGQRRFVTAFTAERMVAEMDAAYRDTLADGETSRSRAELWGN
ncbi:MAG: glycosyltransferase, partial [Sphingomonas sp.]